MMRSSAALLALLLLTAGCLNGVSASPTSTPTDSPTPRMETASHSPTATPPDHRAAANRPDADKAVRVANEWNRSVEMHVRVHREATNETVYEATHDLEPGADRTVYDVSEADPEGIESFTVVVTARNATERVTVETNACYGDAYAEILDDGTLYVYYAIC